jgi:hypothetical protein
VSVSVPVPGVPPTLYVAITDVPWDAASETEDLFVFVHVTPPEPLQLMVYVSLLEPLLSTLNVLVCPLVFTGLVPALVPSGVTVTEYPPHVMHCPLRLPAIRMAAARPAAAERAPRIGKPIVWRVMAGLPGCR